MGEIEELIHNKMIQLYRRTGLDADTILMDEETFNEFKAEISQIYGQYHPIDRSNDGLSFKGMDLFVRPQSEEEFIKLLPLKQLEENRYV